MKFTLVIGLCFFSLLAFAIEIKVKGVSRDGELERSYVLKTELKEKVVLDCQSFVQGLRIGEHERAVYYLMDPEDCEGLRERLKASLRRSLHHCIDVEMDIRADHSC